MTISTKKTLLIVSYVVSIITGVIFIFGIITIPLSVFLFMGGTKMRDMTNLSDTEFEKTLTSKLNLGWAIYILIVTFPFGICALLPYVTDSVKSNINDNEKSEISQGITELDLLFEKKEKGVITKEEYEKLKQKILDKMDNK
ncbi:MAG: SHOCT domain-containing protein [Clostridia bacterium]|nr:SHOCT domain-containing protein [Clostridia bacterium]